jgi:flagellum-specific ATP synthase
MSVLSAQLDAVDSAMPYAVTGQVAAISGLTIEAVDLALPMGALCRITSLGGKTSTAEVIGFDSDRTLLMALSSIAGVSRGDKIENITAAPRIWCSDQLLGRVLNGFGEPIDGKGELLLSESRRIDGRGVQPLQRASAWASSPAPASANRR